MFATVTSGEVQNTAFCNLLQLVAGLLQKQLCFAIGSNEKNVSLHTATSVKCKNTVLCNLSQLVAGLLQKQLCFAIGCNGKNVSLNTAQAVKCEKQRFATCRRFLQKATLFCNVQKRCFCLPCPKFCFLNLHPLFFLATCFSRHCDEVSGKNFCNACCGEGKCQLRHVFCATSAKGQKQ